MINVIGRIVKFAALTSVFAVSSYATTFIGGAYISGGPTLIGNNTNDARQMALLYSQETIANDIDTDGDGLSDSVETNTGVYGSSTDTGTDPNIPDSDGDGLSDSIETDTGTFVSATNTGTDPNNPDSDGDGVSDGNEVSNGTDPNFNENVDQQFQIIEGSFTWQDAKADAEARGGRLAVLNTQEKIDAANTYIQTHSSWDDLWIGLTDELNEGNWFWIDGTLLTDENWRFDEPNNYVDGEDYALIKRGPSYSYPLKWMDYPNDHDATNGGSGATSYLLETLSPVHDDLVLIPGGSFQMGDNLDDISDAPVVNVTVSAFYMGKYEVTKSRWDEVRSWGLSNGYSDLPSGGGKAANHPVQNINWYDMIKWCNALSEKEGLTPCYSLSGSTYRTGNSDSVECNWSANGYRLPTNAEWEKAARGGLTGKRFPWGDTISHTNANYRSDLSYSYDVSDGSIYHPSYNDGIPPYTSPVGSFAANSYGLYDMAGNLWEWCWDWYSDSSYSNGALDPRGASSGSLRVLRGGNWGGNASTCRAANRSNNYPSSSINRYGFRVALSFIDSDDDGLDDSVETNTGIYVSSTDTGTDPNIADSDGDGLSDGAEINTYGSNPNLVDTDGDGVSDGLEITEGTDPNNSNDYNSTSVGLVAYYPFNGNANDESSNSNDGVVYGASLNTDRYGAINRSYSFDGIDDYVDLGDSDILDSGESNYSFSLWFRANTKSSGTYILSKYENKGTNAFGLGTTGGSNYLYSFFAGNIHSDNRSADGNTNINDGQWHHVVMVLDFVSNVYKIFLDGILENTQNLPPTSFGIQNNYPLLIGKQVNGQYFDGNIDDIRIYDRELSPSEVVNIYASEAYQYQVIYGNFTWATAMDDANLRGGQLAVLDTREKINLANSYLNSINTYPYSFIGLSDNEAEGEWRWINGEPLTEHNWATGQPGNDDSKNYGIIRGTDSSFVSQVWLSTDGTSGSYLLESTLNLDTDTDGDGILDSYETNTGVYVSDTDTGTDPNNSDSDGDGLSDGIETNTGIYVSSTDTGTDPNNPDSDGDGLSDGAEVNIYGIDPNLTDTDSDGLSDAVEINTSSFSIIQIDTDDWNDAKLDAENRGGRLAILNTEEKINRANQFLSDTGEWNNLWIGLKYETDPMQFQWINGEKLTYNNWDVGEPNNVASEGGTVVYIHTSINENSPKWNNHSRIDEQTNTYLLEINTGSNPNNADSDGDGLSDGYEVNTSLTNPNNTDSDGDGLSDSIETNSGIFVSVTDTGTDPNIPDSDGDNLSDSVETNTGIYGSSTNTGTDPNNSDSDGDGISDDNEVSNGTDPNVNETVDQQFQIIEGSFTSIEAIKNDAQSRGGRLAILDTSEKHEMAVSALLAKWQESGRFSVAAFGLENESGDWLWVDGTPLDPSDYQFRSGEGSDSPPTIAMLDANNQDWIDGQITSTQSLTFYILEIIPVDTDGDGLNDSIETNTGVYVSDTDTGTDPNIPDSDGDGLSDGAETNTGIYVSGSDTGTDPNIPDSDGDGLSDGAETNTGIYVSGSDTGTDPNNVNVLYTATQLNTSVAESRTLGQQDVTTAPGDFGLHTPAEMSSNRTLGQQDVTSNPSDYNLHTPSEMTVARSESRTLGQTDVTADPGQYGLYTSSEMSTAVALSRSLGQADVTNNPSNYNLHTPAEMTTARSESRTLGQQDVTTTPSDFDLHTPSEMTTARSESRTLGRADVTNAPGDYNLHTPSEMTTARTESRTLGRADVTDAPGDYNLHTPSEMTTARSESRTLGQQDVTTTPSNYNLHTPSEMTLARSESRTLGQQDVTDAPGDYYLHTPSEMTAARSESRTLGQQDVTTTPANYNLHTPTEMTLARSESRTLGQQDVTDAPSDYYLHTPSEMTAARSESRTLGQQDVTTTPANYNLHTPTEMTLARSESRTLGQQDVTDAPSDYYLHTPSEMTAARSESRTLGQTDVTANPDNYSLRTTDESKVQAVGVNSLLMKPDVNNEDQFQIDLKLQKSNDMEVWHSWKDYSETMPKSAGKEFIRVKIMTTPEEDVPEIYTTITTDTYGDKLIYDDSNKLYVNDENTPLMDGTFNLKIDTYSGWSFYAIESVGNRYLCLLKNGNQNVIMFFELDGNFLYNTNIISDLSVYEGDFGQSLD